MNFLGVIGGVPILLVRNLVTAEKSEAENKGGQKSPPIPFLFVRLSVQFSAPPLAEQSVGFSFKIGSSFVFSGEKVYSQNSQCLDWSGCQELNLGLTHPMRK